MSGSVLVEKTKTAHPGRADLFCALGVVVGGTLLLVDALGIDNTAGAKTGIGPATVPLALATLLIVSGVALAITGIRAGKRSHAPQSNSRAEQDVEALLKESEPPVPLKKLLIMILLFIGYAVAFIPLGYLLSTAIFIGIVVTVIDRAKWKRNILFAVGFAVVVYLSFTQLLGVQLPAGLLGLPAGG